MRISDETENGTPAEGGAPEGERIAKTIARAGLASRRDAEAMIEAGRVSLNGQVLTSPAINVTDSDHVVVDGEPLPARERTRLWILHKSRGVVTTARDPEGRQTVFDGLPPDLPRVVAIGRLDINTEGLLLLTNDGGLAKVIAHPETGWLRRYRVRAFGDVTQPDLDKLRKGVSIDGMDYGPIEASLDRAQGDNVWLTLGLREGKNREVKRILEHLGLSVNRLIRLSFGPFQLGDLEVGLVEEIRTKVLKEQLGKNLSEQAGVDFESPVREPIAPFGSPKKKAAQGAMAPKPPRSGPSPRGDFPRGDFSRGDRAPGRERPGGARPPRDPARPPVPTRVPTGGMGSGPRSSIWRAEDAETRPHGTRVPRRGGDPKAARAAAAERGRERVGAITTGERRVVVERLQPTPEAPQSEPHRRVKFRKHDEAAPRRAEGERPPRRDRGESGEGGASRGPARARPPRDEFREGGGPRGPARSGRDARDAAPRGEQPFRAPRGDRPAQGRPDHGRPGQGRSDQGRPGQERPRSDRPNEERGARPGGFRGGKPEGRPGGFKDARPGGARPGGFKDGKPGGRPGGAGPGGFRGGKPGGAGSGGFKGGRSGGGRSGGSKPGGGKPGPRGGR